MAGRLAALASAASVAAAASSSSSSSAAAFGEDIWSWHVPRRVPSLSVAARRVPSVRGVAAPFSVEATAHLEGDAYPVASLTFTDTIQSDGWSHLQLSTNSSYDDEEQAYAAGYLEATQTWRKIYQGVVNSGANFSYTPAIAAYLSANDVWVRSQIVDPANAGDPYWHHVWLALLQVDGLIYGYKDAAGPGFELPPSAIVNVQLSGDMEDLSAYKGAADAAATTGAAAAGMSRSRSKSPRRALRAQRRAAALGLAVSNDADDDAGHCSAMVALTQDGTELFFAQVTWAGFEDMTRVYKAHTLPYSLTGMKGDESVVPAATVTFSSEPGSIFSGDDFYTMSSGLAMLETTIGNSNSTLYDLYLNPVGSVLEYVRNTVANRLARDGASWAAIYSRYNSGTYNNENIVVDYSKFVPAHTREEDGVRVGPALLPGLLTALDQVPGNIVWEDVTPELAAVGYVASYNVARFPFIFNISGGAVNEAKGGPWFSFNNTARANIFRARYSTVVDEASMRALMRYNDFQHDPLSTQGCSGNPPSSAENAISARDDLNPASGVYPIDALGHRDHAGIDAKLTSYALMKGGAPAGSWAASARAVSGPTYDQQPVFVWSKSDYAGLPHLGMPDAWQFDWVDVGL